MKVVRRLSAVFAGSVIFAGAIAVARQFQANGFITHLVWTVLAALAAGWVTGRIARAHEVAHAAAIGLFIVMAAIVVMRQRGATQPGPYELTLAGCGPISVMIGAAMAMVQRLQATAPKISSTPSRVGTPHFPSPE